MECLFFVLCLKCVQYFKGGQVARKLIDIDITHISLVHAGANKKDIIYKSRHKTPTKEHRFNISKSEPEKGLIYGIVYAPDEVDTDGDFATAEEIEKAAYSFMKNLRLQNIDKDHTFVNEDAYICESWLVRANDALFANEPIGSWAVCIKLESEALKQAVKSGEIAGISMAGESDSKEEEVKSMETLKTLKSVVKNLFTKKSKDEENEEMSDELKAYLEELNKTVADGFEKLGTEIETLKEKNKELEKGHSETMKVLKKSRQNNTTPSADDGAGYDGKGIV